MRPLPKRYLVGGKTYIPIRQVSREHMAVAGDPSNGGFYDHGNRVIWIDKTLPIQEKWRVYLHERKHLLIEWYDELVVHKTWKPWED